MVHTTGGAGVALVSKEELTQILVEMATYTDRP